MTDDEQIAICKAIAVSCMWGQGGIASVILDHLQKRVPAPRGWKEVEGEVSKSAKREAMGVITTREELDHYRREGYWLTNFDDDGCSLFNPPPMNGLAKYVSKEIADEIKAEQTMWKGMPI